MLVGQSEKEHRPMSRKSNAAIATIGIDPGKNTLHLIGLDARGEIVLRERVARDRIVARLVNVPPCLIGIEAGMGTHYVSRELAAVGHDVRQVPAIYAKPFRQTHKNDFRDALAVAEAVQRPTTRCSPRIAHMRRALMQEPYEMSSLGFTKGIAVILLRPRRSPNQVSERRWLRRDDFS
jgi:transposase